MHGFGWNMEKTLTSEFFKDYYKIVREQFEVFKKAREQFEETKAREQIKEAH